MAEAFSAEVEHLLQQQLATGKYASQDELLLEALQVLAERNRRREELRREIQVGRGQLDRGEYTDYDQASLRRYFDELQEQGRQRYEAGKKGRT